MQAFIGKPLFTLLCLLLRVGCSAADRYRLKQHFAYSACAEQRLHDTHDPGGYAEAYEICKGTVAFNHLVQLGSQVSAYREANKKLKDPLKEQAVCWKIGLDMYEEHLLQSGVKIQDFPAVFSRHAWLNKSIADVDTPLLIAIRTVMADKEPQLRDYYLSPEQRYQCNTTRMQALESGIGLEINRRQLSGKP